MGDHSTIGPWRVNDATGSVTVRGPDRLAVDCFADYDGKHGYERDRTAAQALARCVCRLLNDGEAAAKEVERLRVELAAMTAVARMFRDHPDGPPEGGLPLTAEMCGALEALDYEEAGRG